MEDKSYLVVLSISWQKISHSSLPTRKVYTRFFAATVGEAATERGYICKSRETKRIHAVPGDLYRRWFIIIYA